MKYKLAKQLKDAGFPQRNERILYCYPLKEDNVAYPILEELIEACNCQCFNLDKRAKWASGGQWFCEGSILKEGEDDIKVDLNKMPELTKRGFGDTPEEAVANLWLELKKHRRD